MLSSRTRRSGGRAAGTSAPCFRHVGRTYTALGAFYRRLSSRIGKAKAVTATARKIASSVLQCCAIRNGLCRSRRLVLRDAVTGPSGHQFASACQGIRFVLQPLEPKVGACRFLGIHSPAPTLRSWREALSSPPAAESRGVGAKKSGRPLRAIALSKPYSGSDEHRKPAPSSISVFSPFRAAKATFALKAGAWFRRGRFGHDLS